MITHIVSDWLFSPCCVEHQDESILERVAVAYSKDYYEVERAQIKLDEAKILHFTVYSMFYLTFCNNLLASKIRN